MRKKTSLKMIHLLCALACVFLAPHLHAAETAWPGAQWEQATPAAVDMDAAKLAQARDYALTGGGSGCITRHGKLVLTWGDPRTRYDLKSSTKSFGSIALGLALKDGKVALDDKARKHHPAFGAPCDRKAPAGSNAAPTGQQAAWMDEITLLHLATQTAGFEKAGGSNKLLFQPGSYWFYSDSGPNWLAECLTLAYHRDIDELMFERVFTPLGITRSDLVWRKNSYRPELIDGLARREFDAGISANVGALARVGLLMLREGQWNGREILTRDYARTSPRVPQGHEKLRTWEGDPHGRAASHYGMLWWNNADGTIQELPRDAFWSWGLYDSFILVIPSLDIVASRAGQSWKRQENANSYDVLKPFFVPIAQAVRSSGPTP